MNAQFQRISWGEIKHVQNLIERCLHRYMSQTEIIAALQIEANIEPGFTCLVWQKLEEQNPSFFYVYNVLLRLKDQIVAFNYLVDCQEKIEHQIQKRDIEGITGSGTVELSALSPAFVDASKKKMFPPNEAEKEGDSVATKNKSVP